jgi:hypothetical protein
MSKTSFRPAASVGVRYPALLEASRSLRDWGLVAIGSLWLMGCQRKTVDQELGMRGGIDLTRLPADASVDVAVDAAGDASVEPRPRMGVVPANRLKIRQPIDPQHPHAKKKPKK